MTEVTRRTFLSLILAAPFASPALTSIAPPRPAEHPRLPLINRARARGLVQRYALPFSPDVGFASLVEPGRVARFLARPQIEFRPDRLLIAPNEVGRDAEGLTITEPSRFELLNVSAAGEPQSEDTLPAWMFDPTSLGGGRLEFDIIPPGQIIVLAARNLGRKPAKFSAMMLGNAGRPE